jgi:hypothetical protein
MQASKAYFMVRAQVPDERERTKFDQWYGTHHLPLAMDKFLPRKAGASGAAATHRSTMRSTSSKTWQRCATVSTRRLSSCLLPTSIRHGPE